jgi:hypothetical protein
MRRLVLAVLLSLLAPACGLKAMLPVGPVLTSWERTQAFPGDTPSGVAYTGAPKVPFPVLPVQVFGATYDVDLVLESTDPEWNMHEYAMLRTPDGPLWLAKDAREATKSQSIVADVPDIDRWMPEIPLPRKSWPLKVDDRSTDDRLDIDIAYQNIDGQDVKVHYEGKGPGTRQRKRNGSTFGHSANEVLVALDVSDRDFGREASIEIGGKNWKLRRILGLVPFDMVLRQTQGGIAITDLELTRGGVWEQEPAEREVVGAVPPEASDAGGVDASGVPMRGFTGTYAMVDGKNVPTRWDVEQGDRYVDAYQYGTLRTLHYRFRRVDDDTWELWWTEARQWGQPVPATHIEFHPSLPDLRRPFDGRFHGRFVLDVDGQQSHAVGNVEAWWDGGTPHLKVVPTAPWFVADRPMETTVTYGGGGAHVRTTRIPVEPASE